jgi:HlyD family secretion protein
MSGMFRERALESVSSPEQLDRLVRVTSPRTWLALGALLAVIAGALTWASTSTVPTTLSGTGFLLPEGGLRQVVAPNPGTLNGLRLAAGAHVVSGEPVGSTTDGRGGSLVVRAPETGVITEVDALPDAYAPAGKRLALIEPVGWPLVVYSYVATRVAAVLKPGTPVEVRLGAGISDTYGFVRGTVAAVSRFPATEDRLSFVLQDASVVSEIGRLGPANEVIIALAQSAHNPSGLVWGSGHGPDRPLPAGLPASAKFIVGSHHPIDDFL